MSQALTLDRLRELLTYDPLTGVFVSNGSRGKVAMGKPAGTKNAGCYVQICLDGRVYLAHRLAWFLHFGHWPKLPLDHVNRVRDDNRIENLREATNAENQQNRVTPKACNKSSSYLGVSWSKAANAWQARIQTNKKQRHIGFFRTEKEAGAAYLEEKRRVHQFASADVWQ